ncbi:hypothetical protein E0765_09050 [Sulfuricurvum sp. IAE1]|uniref:hypothetical protein n=1 Tax=Sulfuricurvum sp. IAE1 TaxID=2546102 RepID=UPI00104D42A5|nr:hypothetical protein [Sulfuricurvum sp. IAE1]TDA62726.1 hypothetical protein E0765_09050 [Sulfuricurvum sp. IAE1]
MTILLFNDNPVVQKLVSLSAQKTKDDLSVAASLDEVSGSEYDLLIIDDALYSEEVFGALKERITCKSALFMATRGNIVPAGFDNVINKPFLPTDLVETLIQIDKSIAPAAAKTAPAAAVQEDPYAIDLQETLAEVDHDAEGFLDHDLDAAGDDFSLDDLEGFGDDETPKTAVLDSEEVQEVQGLLEAAESDALIEEDEITVKGIDDFGVPEKPEMEDEAFDFEGLVGSENTDASAEDEFDFEGLIGVEGDETAAETEPDLSAAEALSAPESPEEELMFGEIPDETAGEEIPENALPELEEDEPFDFGEDFADAGLLSEEPEDEAALPDLPESGDALIDDEAFGELEFQIQEAVDELEPEDLDMELDAGVLEEFDLGDGGEGSGGFDEFDTLDERELKLAIGEEVEEEPEIRVGGSEFASLGAEALAEASGHAQAETMAPKESFAAEMDEEGTHAEGVEALQALLKALSNEEVAKSLKGLNISININFGNDK